MGQKEDIIPLTPYKPEVEAKMKKIIQETELNDVYNKAYNKFQTHEFNPEHEDFKKDLVQQDDSTTTNQELALVLVDKGMIYLLVCNSALLGSYNIICIELCYIISLNFDCTNLLY